MPRLLHHISVRYLTVLTFGIFCPKALLAIADLWQNGLQTAESCRIWHVRSPEPGPN